MSQHTLKIRENIKDENAQQQQAGLLLTVLTLPTLDANALRRIFGAMYG